LDFEMVLILVSLKDNAAGMTYLVGYVVNLQLFPEWGMQWHSWLRHCTTSQKVACWIPNGIGIFSLT
jgi:hypothetical protein